MEEVSRYHMDKEVPVGRVGGFGLDKECEVKKSNLDPMIRVETDPLMGL